MEDEVTIMGVALPGVMKFRYLGSAIQDKQNIDKDINQLIKAGWKEWKNVARVLRDKEDLAKIARDNLPYGC